MWAKNRAPALWYPAEGLRGQAEMRAMDGAQPGFGAEGRAL